MYISSIDLDQLSYHCDRCVCFQLFTSTSLRGCPRSTHVPVFCVGRFHANSSVSIKLHKVESCIPCAIHARRCSVSFAAAAAAAVDSLANTATAGMCSQRFPAVADASEHSKSSQHAQQNPVLLPSSSRQAMLPQHKGTSKPRQPTCTGAFPPSQQLPW